MSLEITENGTSSDRRRLERFRLAEPMRGRLGSTEVRVLEIGLLGARIELQESVKMSSVLVLGIETPGASIELAARVVRIELDADLSNAVGETIYQAGLSFEAVPARSAEALRDLVTELVSSALSLQKANAHGRRSDWDRLSSLTAKRRPSSEDHPDLYICCRLMGGGTWQRSTILKPTQPRLGITVRADASEEEVDLLCRTYAEADDEGRKLIRLCAELSLVDESQLPSEPNL